MKVMSKCCDNCFHYHWYYDYCDEWNCKVDDRSICDKFAEGETMEVDKEYIIEHCQDKQRLYGIDICMLQTEPCKRAVEQNRCPKIWWGERRDNE